MNHTENIGNLRRKNFYYSPRAAQNQPISMCDYQRMLTKYRNSKEITSAVSMPEEFYNITKPANLQPISMLDYLSKYRSSQAMDSIVFAPVNVAEKITLKQNLDKGEFSNHAGEHKVNGHGFELLNGCKGLYKNDNRFIARENEVQNQLKAVRIRSKALRNGIESGNRFKVKHKIRRKKDFHEQCKRHSIAKKFSKKSRLAFDSLKDEIRKYGEMEIDADRHYDGSNMSFDGGETLVHPSNGSSKNINEHLKDKERDCKYRNGAEIIRRKFPNGTRCGRDEILHPLSNPKRASASRRSIFVDPEVNERRRSIYVDPEVTALRQSIYANPEANGIRRLTYVDSEANGLHRPIYVDSEEAALRYATYANFDANRLRRSTYIVPDANGLRRTTYVDPEATALRQSISVDPKVTALPQSTYAIPEINGLSLSIKGGHQSCESSCEDTYTNLQYNGECSEGAPKNHAANYFRINSYENQGSDEFVKRCEGHHEKIILHHIKDGKIKENTPRRPVFDSNRLRNQDEKLIEEEKSPRIPLSHYPKKYRKILPKLHSASKDVNELSVGEILPLKYSNENTKKLSKELNEVTSQSRMTQSEYPSSDNEEGSLLLNSTFPPMVKDSKMTRDQRHASFSFKGELPNAKLNTDSKDCVIIKDTRFSKNNRKRATNFECFCSMQRSEGRCSKMGDHTLSSAAKMQQLLSRKFRPHSARSRELKINPEKSSSQAPVSYEKRSIAGGTVIYNRPIITHLAHKFTDKRNEQTQASVNNKKASTGSELSSNRKFSSLADENLITKRSKGQLYKRLTRLQIFLLEINIIRQTFFRNFPFKKYMSEERLREIVLEEAYLAVLRKVGKPGPALDPESY